MIGYLFQNALRAIRGSPTSSLVIVASIAIGMAVSLTMIAFYNGMQVEPIPHKNTQVYRVLLDNWQAEKPFAEPDFSPPAVTLQDANFLRASQGDGDYALMYHGTSFVTQRLDGLQRQIKMSTRATSRGFFSLFEPQFLFGGPWDSSADEGMTPVVVLAKSVNDRLFGGRDSVGQEVEINGTPHRIVGVLDTWDIFPLYYDMTREDIVADELFVPFDVAVRNLEMWPSFSASPQQSDAAKFAERIASGETVFVQYWVSLATPPAAAAYRQLLDHYIAGQKALGRFPRAAKAELIDVPRWIDRQQDGGNQRIFMQTLLVVSLLFFAICLLNIVTLLIARFMGNASEVSIMRALGASKVAVFSERLIEVGLLGLVGGAAGLFLARAGIMLLGPMFMGADQDGSGASMTSDPGGFAALLLGADVILMGLGLALLGAVLVALYPTWRICRISPAEYLKSN